jgi:DNA-binding GntR family transcriptional regulator
MSPSAQKVHRYIKDYEAAHGMMPLRKEICAEFGWKSQGCAYRAIKELSEAGVLKRRGQRFALAEHSVERR